MNKLILSVFMLLAVSKSNGQKVKDTSSLKYYPNKVYYGTSLFTNKSEKVYTISDFYNKPQSLYFMREGNITSAYLTPPSDTLYITDTVIELYNNKIRYIKIGNKVYPLKTN